MHKHWQELIFDLEFISLLVGEDTYESTLLKMFLFLFLIRLDCHLEAIWRLRPDQYRNKDRRQKLALGKNGDWIIRCQKSVNTPDSNAQDQTSKGMIKTHPWNKKRQNNHDTKRVHTPDSNTEDHISTTTKTEDKRLPLVQKGCWIIRDQKSATLHPSLGAHLQSLLVNAGRLLCASLHKDIERRVAYHRQIAVVGVNGVGL